MRGECVGLPSSVVTLTQAESWETEITGGHGWWKPWRWEVVHHWPDFHSDIRLGSARTEDKARRAAVRAQLAMGREDVHLVELSESTEEEV